MSTLSTKIAMRADLTAYKKRSKELADRLRQRRGELKDINDARENLGLSPVKLSLNLFEARIVDDLKLWDELQTSQEVDNSNFTELQETIKKENQELESQIAQSLSIINQIANLGPAQQFKIIDEFGMPRPNPDYDRWANNMRSLADKVKGKMLEAVHNADPRLMSVWDSVVKYISNTSPQLAQNIKSEVETWNKKMVDTREKYGDIPEKDTYIPKSDKQIYEEELQGKIIDSDIRASEAMLKQYGSQLQGAQDDGTTTQ